MLAQHSKCTYMRKVIKANAIFVNLSSSRPVHKLGKRIKETRKRMTNGLMSMAQSNKFTQRQPVCRWWLVRTYTFWQMKGMPFCKNAVFLIHQIQQLMRNKELLSIVSNHTCSFISIYHAVFTYMCIFAL